MVSHLYCVLYVQELVFEIDVDRLYRDKREEVYGACDATYEQRFTNASRKLDELRETSSVEGEVIRVGDD